MNFMYVHTPNQHPDEWLKCQIIDVNLNADASTGIVKLKGIAKSTNVTTTITINDVQSLREGKVISSLRGYFKMKIAPGDEPVQNLFSLINNLGSHVSHT